MCFFLYLHIYTYIHIHIHTQVSKILQIMPRSMRNSRPKMWPSSSLPREQKHKRARTASLSLGLIPCKSMCECVCVFVRAIVEVGISFTSSSLSSLTHTHTHTQHSVDRDGTILEKPADEREAFAMLKSLQGRQHLVHSGVAVFSSLGPCEEGEGKGVPLPLPVARFSETARVTFAPLTDEEIWSYVR